MSQGNSGVRRRCQEQGLTQVQLAEQMGVAQQAVTGYESGQRRVPISHLPRLAALLGTSMESLLGEEPKPGKRGQRQAATAAGTRQPMPKARQRMVSEVIDSLLAQTTR